MAPNRASAASASASMSDNDDTSVRSPSTGTPAADNSATVASRASAWMSPITTFIPSAPQRSANALPMPLPAPVTTAVLPANSSTNKSPNECRPLTKRPRDDPDQGPRGLQPPQRVGGAVQRHPLRHQPLDRHLPGRQVADGLAVGLVRERARADHVMSLADQREQGYRSGLGCQRHLDHGPSGLGDGESLVERTRRGRALKARREKRPR